MKLVLNNQIGRGQALALPYRQAVVLFPEAPVRRNVLGRWGEKSASVTLPIDEAKERLYVTVPGHLGEFVYRRN